MGKTKRSPDLKLMGALQPLMDEDELIDLIANAEAEGRDVDQVLRDKFDELKSPGDNGAPTAVAELLSQFGLAIVPKRMKTYDRRTRKESEITIGFIIARETESGTLYGGKQLSWGNQNNAIPCFDHDEAEQLACYYADVLRLNQETFDFAVKTVSVNVPIESNPIPAKSGQMFSIKCDPETTGTIYAVLRALRKRNEEHAGRPLQSGPDVIRYILRQVWTQATSTKS